MASQLDGSGGRRGAPGTTAARLALLCALVLLTQLMVQGTQPAPVRAGSVDWPDAVDDTFTIYLATPQAGGSDTNDGLSRTDPIASLHKAHEVLRSERPETDVEIRIGPGTYEQAPMDEWRFYVPGHTISFLPQDYRVGGQEPDESERPVFRNARCPQQGSGDQFCNGSWFTARPSTEQASPFHSGGNSGLRFYHLTLERYSAGGISIRGDSDRDVENENYDPPLRTPGVSLDGNVFEGLVFREIGNRWSNGHYGWGGIVLTGSSDNRIVHNTFQRIENKKKHDGFIHGVYVTHFSNNNEVRDNTFETISGDPIKVRDRSNNNVFADNVFTDAGKLSFFTAEFCGKQCAQEHDKAQECPSVGNRFVDNTLGDGYGGRSIDLFTYSSGSYPSTNASACGKLSEKRLRTEGNVTDR